MQVANPTLMYIGAALNEFRRSCIYVCIAIIILEAKIITENAINVNVLGYMRTWRGKRRMELREIQKEDGIITKYHQKHWHSVG